MTTTRGLTLVKETPQATPEAKAQWIHDALGFTIPPDEPVHHAPSVGILQMFKAASDGEVRPSEIIVGSASPQTSSGELTYLATKGGQDFADGARAAAEENSRSGEARFGDASHPMQSPDLSGSGFFLRYGIGFLCSVYLWPYPNLADIDAYSKPNSAFLASFKGLDKSRQYKNPEKSEIVDHIGAWVDMLTDDLPEGATGELVVTFQGHGIRGSFIASDGDELTSGEMMALARMAETRRVSLTIVMDACHAGGAVPVFQAHAADAQDRRVEAHVEGAGEVSSVENHEAADALRDELAQARELVLFSAALAAHGRTLNDMLNMDWSSESAALRSIEIEDGELRELVRSMELQFRTNMRFDHAPAELHARIEGAFKAVNAAMGQIHVGGYGVLNGWSEAIGVLQDRISDAANKIIVALNKASAPR